MGFHHVALGCNDFDRSVAFYNGKLGLPATYGWGETPGRAILLAVGNGAFLELFERPDIQPCACGTDAPILHFAIASADVDAQIAIVRAEGLEVTVEPKDVTIPGVNGNADINVHLAFFKGPGGELVELFQVKE